MTESLDNVLLNIRNDDSQVNVRKIRDHLVEQTVVGLSLRARLNNDTGATVPWELTGKHSDNFGSLPLFLQGNLLVTLGYIPESLAYEDFWVEYRLKDSDSSGSIGRIED